MLPVDENRPAQDVPLADDGPTAHLFLRHEQDGENAAEHDTVDVSDVIGNDNVTAALELPLVAGNGDFDIENRAQQQSVNAIDPASDFPAVGHAEHRDP